MRDIDLDTDAIADRRVPDFFIVGAPRSGTTSLYEYLGQHPQTHLADPKEPHFLANDLDSGSYPDSLYFVRELDPYLALFSGAGRDQLAGEGSTSYLSSTLAARNIRQLNPQARIIVMLREPTDMLASFHRRRLFSGSEDIERFDEALAAEPERRLGRRLPPHARNIPALFYREMGRYADQVERFLAVFPRDQILFLVFDDFRVEPLAAYRQTVGFLGMDPSLEPELTIENATRAIRSRRMQRLLLDPGLIKVGRALLPSGLHRRVRPLIDAVNSRGGRDSNPGHSAQGVLREELRPQVTRLGELVGRDLIRLWSY